MVCRVQAWGMLRLMSKEKRDSVGSSPGALNRVVSTVHPWIWAVIKNFKAKRRFAWTSWRRSYTNQSHEHCFAPLWFRCWCPMPSLSSTPTIFYEPSLVWENKLFKFVCRFLLLSFSESFGDAGTCHFYILGSIFGVGLFFFFLVSAMLAVSVRIKDEPLEDLPSY